MLFKKIKEDSLQARRNKEKAKASIYSFLISEIKTIEKNDSKMSNFDIDSVSLTVLKKAIKSVRENIKARPNEESYKNELDLYMSYLPKQLSEDELSEIISRWKIENYPDNPGIGGMMQSLKRVYDGQYDPKVASMIVKKIFSEDK